MSRKMANARKMCSVGRYPSLYAALFGHLSHDLLERLTAREIALVIDAMYANSKEVERITEREIIGEGCVWDEYDRCMREIAPVGAPMAPQPTQYINARTGEPVEYSCALDKVPHLRV